MAKSAGNSFILSDIERQGIDPLAFRYLCLTARHKTRLNFTFSSLKAAQRGWLRLRNRVWEWTMSPASQSTDGEAVEDWQGRFMERVNDNLDMPGALRLVWKASRSDLPPRLKLEILREFDRVLGLGLDQAVEAYRVPDEVQRLVDRRSGLREQGDYDEADTLRASLDEKGYVVEDAPTGTRARPKTPWELQQEEWPSISSSAEAESMIDGADEYDFTIGIVACNYLEDVKRCVKGARRWSADHRAEVVVLDNGSTDGTERWLEDEARKSSALRVIHTDHVLGEGAAKNIVLKAGRGKTVVLVDTSAEFVGDVLTRVDEILADPTIGMAGPFGLRTDNLHHFHDGEGEAGDMDAMQAYCLALRRERLRDVGLMRESFRFYRNLDLDYSFHFKEKGYRIVSDPGLPVRLHEHRIWSELPEGERDELSKKNYRRFLDKWGDRADLLVSSRGAL